MNYYLILPFILLIISIIYFNHYTKSKESFEPWMNFNQPDYKDVNYQSRYNDCMQQGYGDDFCTQSSVPNYKDTLPPEGRCNCVDGRYGTYQHNGKCFCYIHDESNGEFTQNLFTAYTAEGQEWLKNVEAYGRKK